MGFTPQNYKKSHITVDYGIMVDIHESILYLNAFNTTTHDFLLHVFYTHEYYKKRAHNPICTSKLSRIKKLRKNSIKWHDYLKFVESPTALCSYIIFSHIIRAEYYRQPPQVYG